MTLALGLAERLQGVSFSDLPGEAVHAAQLSLADALCVMLAATRLEPAVLPFHTHALAGGFGPATLLGGGKATASLAALANGALSHALDFEDTYDAAGLHPNAVIIPAALALAEAEALSGPDLLFAIATGCDIACRIGEGLASDPAARGWYHPPIIAAAGAAFGASRMLRLTPEQTVSAVSLALCQFSLTDELKRSPRSDLRAVRDAFAARAVVEACCLARSGVRGVDAPLDGASGLFAMLTGDRASGDLLAGFGAAFRGADVTFKHWPCCRGTHPSIALALELRERGIGADDIEAMSLSVSPPDDMLMLPEADRKRPASMVAAKFSIPFCFALAMRRSEVTLEGFMPEARSDPAVLDVAAKVSLDRVIPPGALERPAARVLLVNGASYEVIVPEAPGNRASETTFDQMAPKFADCLRHAGRERIQQPLIEQVAALGHAPGMAGLTAVLTSDPASASTRQGLADID